MQCAVHGLQEEEGAKHGNHQAITDDESALEAHGNHQDCNHDEYRFHQVDGEGAERIAYPFGLVEYLVNLQAGREAVGFQLFHDFRHLISHLDNVGVARCSNQDTDGTCPVEEEFIAGRFFVSLLDTGNVTQAELVIVMSLDKHVADVFYGLELVADGHTDAVIAIIIITGIGGLVLSVQGGEHFHRLHAEVGHAVLK